jgi:hypothetical protein
MESPQTHQWGPALWMILHSSVERIGSKSTKLLEHEETRLWTGLLSSLRYSLPCPQCKKHYSDYLQRYPIISVSQSFLRYWLFQLHQEVNHRNNKNSDITIENIPEIYSKPFHFSRHASVFQTHMRFGLSHNWVTRNDMQRTIRFLEEMRRFYDFF